MSVLCVPDLFLEPPSSVHTSSIDQHHLDFPSSTYSYLASSRLDAPPSLCNSACVSVVSVVDSGTATPRPPTSACCSSTQQRTKSAKALSSLHKSTAPVTDKSVYITKHDIASLCSMRARVTSADLVETQRAICTQRDLTTTEHAVLCSLSQRRPRLPEELLYAESAYLHLYAHHYVTAGHACETLDLLVSEGIVSVRELEESEQVCELRSSEPSAKLTYQSLANLIKRIIYTRHI